MTHEEFLEKYSRGNGNSSEYFIEQLPDDWYGPDNKWCNATTVGRYLKKVGLTITEWYGLYVPNPGCSECGSPVELRQLLKGWYHTCSNECEYLRKSKVSTSMMNSRWSNPEWCSHVSNLSRTQWLNPEYVRDMYISKMESLGYTQSEVYVGTGKGYIKFGLSVEVVARIDSHDLELNYSTGMIDLRDAAQLECDIKKAFPELFYDESAGDGWTEFRHPKYLESIINFIKSWSSK